MDLSELRISALRQAAEDEKHQGGSLMSLISPPAPSAVISRAEAYLRFLMNEKATPVRKATRNKVAR